MKRVIPLILALVFSSTVIPSANAYPSGTKLGWATVRTPGSSIPAMRSDLVEGVGDRELAQGLGHWPETALPGRGGRVVFSGHRTTHLRPLYDLDRWPKGSILRLYMQKPVRRALCYRLASKRIVREDDTSPAYYSTRPGEVVLTFACHPKGQRTHRIIGFWWRVNCSDVD